MGPETVKLGGREYEIVEQQIGRIRRKLTAVWAMFSGEGEGVQATEIGPQLYEALEVFIPKGLAPYWELAGYMSKAEFEAEQSGEDFEASEYDPDSDRSPTIPEITATIETIFRVNDGERLKRIFFALVKRESIQDFVDGYLKKQKVEMLDKAGQKMRNEPSPPSPSSPHTNGASDPTSSGTRPPTPNELAHAAGPPAD